LRVHYHCYAEGPTMRFAYISGLLQLLLLSPCINFCIAEEDYVYIPQETDPPYTDDGDYNNNEGWPPWPWIMKRTTASETRKTTTITRRPTTTRTTTTRRPTTTTTTTTTTTPTTTTTTTRRPTTTT
ncbi:hypothetical protein GCK32_019803, partial [Trichostrongylus colubriformis]